MPDMQTIKNDVTKSVGRAERVVEQALDEQIRTRPLVVGGVAIGLGTALGALFSNTRIGRLIVLGATGFAAYLYVTQTKGGKKLLASFR